MSTNITRRQFVKDVVATSIIASGVVNLNAKELTALKNSQKELSETLGVSCHLKTWLKTKENSK